MYFVCGSIFPYYDIGINKPNIMTSKLYLNLTREKANFVLRSLKQRRSQNPAKHLRWSFFVKINNLCKKPSSQIFDRVLTMPLIRSCKFQTVFSIIVFGVKITGFIKPQLFVGRLRGVLRTNQTSKMELFAEIVSGLSR